MIKKKLKNPHLILGLGNPGNRYHLTRHNIGFLLIDTMIDSYKIKYSAYLSGVLLSFCNICGLDLILIKSLAYINHSGVFIPKVLSYYDISPKKIIILHDDVDISFGRLKISERGDSGHNGVKSLASVLGNNDFIRLRMGIGRPDYLLGNMVEHVLGKFSNLENILLNSFILKGFMATISVLCLGPREAMNQFNGWKT